MYRNDSQYIFSKVAKASGGISLGIIKKGMYWKFIKL